MADTAEDGGDGALQGLPDWARRKVEAALRDPAACTELELGGYDFEKDEWRDCKITALPTAFFQLTALTK